MKKSYYFESMKGIYSSVHTKMQISNEDIDTVIEGFAKQERERTINEGIHALTAGSGLVYEFKDGWLHDRSPKDVPFDEEGYAIWDLIEKYLKAMVVIDLSQ